MKRGMEKAHRLKKVVELYLYEHRTQADIAEKLGVCQKTISNDLKCLEKEWTHSALLDFHQAKSRELARIDRLEKEYWSAWKQSTGENEMNHDVENKKGLGNPRYLQGIQWCINKRCELLGVNVTKSANRETEVTFSDLVRESHANNGQ